AVIDYTVEPNRRQATVDVMFNIQENKQSVVTRVDVSGNNWVSRGLISSQIRVKPTEVLNAAELANSRANLYQTGAFQLVEITRKDDPPPPMLQPHQKAIALEVH